MQASRAAVITHYPLYPGFLGWWFQELPGFQTELLLL